ncbi:MAG: 4Fe-4S dicluster domain-containing protein [Candidatus Bathyarchaeia archaeon]
MRASETNDMTDKIRQISRSLLEAKEADYVIGYELETDGSVCPVFIDCPEEVEKLVWNDRCIHNLASFLKKTIDDGESRVAIVSKGCDVKSIVALLQEGQIVRDKIKVLGVDCSGQRDEKGNLLLKCKLCRDHRPLLYDSLIANERVDVREFDVDSVDYSEVEDVEKMSVEERLRFWKEEAEKCIRCYACREVCPLCYCVECFTDQNLPKYVPSTPSIKGNFLWLLMRAFDLAGRCTGCMECDRVCPVDIPLHLLNRKAIKDVATLFGYEAGRNPSEKPLLAVFSEEDPDEFIK